ncbi:MAG: creatininase family protein [Clostridiales bacterium]|nr:creatininase family protein [Clostridiales bacterium]
MSEKKRIILEEMTWPEVREALDKGMRIVIIPAASIEQHGPHLTLITDALLGANAAYALALKLGNALVAPVIRPGLSSHHMSFPGTLTLRPETFAALIEDYITSYVRHGFKIIILMSAHGGNTQTILKLVPELRRKFKDTTIIATVEVPTIDELEHITKLAGLPMGACGGHADDRETSEMLHLAPRYARMSQAKQGFVGKLDEKTLNKFFEQGVTALSDTGVVGDPRNANAERGAWYIKQTIDRLERDVRDQLRKEGIEIESS